MTQLDSALSLKLQVQQGQKISDKDIHHALISSQLVSKLSTDTPTDILSCVWRLIGLAEIPFTKTLPATQSLIENVISKARLPEGFTITGKRDDIYPCYNAMLTATLIRLGCTEEQVKPGIEWLLNHQAFERGKQPTWDGKGILKYGGCVKNTPCYIGVVKAVDALSCYTQHFKVDQQHQKALSQGLEYLLSHHLYQRLNSEGDITRAIRAMSYPFSYKVNILELLRLMKVNNRLADERCQPALALLKRKQKKDGFWRVNDVFTGKGWIAFDARGEPGHWLSNEIEQVMSNPVA